MPMMNLPQKSERISKALNIVVLLRAFYLYSHIGEHF